MLKGFPKVAAIASSWPAVLAICILLLVARRPDAFIKPQFWAEDFLFLTDAETSGFHSLIEPKAGYLHAIPRLAALTARIVDPILQPAVFLVWWLIVWGLLFFSIYSPRSLLPGKSLLALATVLVPHQGEVFFNPTNAQWIGGLALVLVALRSDPKSPIAWTFDVGVLILLGLSGPFSIVCVPLLLLRWWHERSWQSAVLFVTCLSVAIVQYRFIASYPPDTEFTGPFSAASLLAAFCYRIPAGLVVGAAFLPNLGRATIIGVGLMLIAGMVWRTCAVRGQRILLTLVAAMILFFVVGTLRKRFDLWAHLTLTGGDRYFYIPKVIALWVLTIVACTDPKSVARWAASTALVASMIVNTTLFRFPDYREYGWYAQCDDIRSGKEVVVTVNPDWKFRYQRGKGIIFGPYH